MNSPSKSNAARIPHLRLILFAIIFLFFAIIGFILFQQVLGVFVHKTASTVPTLAVPVYPNQGNLLLIHSNQVNNSPPRLTSIWAVFISKNDPPSLIARPLYPDNTSPENNQKIEDAFAYSQEKGLSEEFIKAMQVYDWQWNAYVIIDDEGLTHLSQWINNTQSAPDFAAETAKQQDLLQAEKNILQSICKNLAKPENQRGETPHWKELIPKHMQTDLFFKDAAVNWDHITFSTPAPNCKILLTP